MWIFSTDGFYSIALKPGDTTLTIRARCAEDLDRLRERWLPTLGPTIVGAGTDYPVRASCERRDLADALMAQIMDLDYSNFKGRLAQTLGGKHVEAAHQVWEVMHLLEKKASETTKRPPAGMAAAYGGVVISEDHQQVLLREPHNHFGGYVWTFAKGRPNRGETPWTCAEREIREELGCTVRDAVPIPGWYPGDTTSTQYYLCTHAGTARSPDQAETASVRWATWEEAHALVSLTRSANGRKRDLAVLAAAKALACAQHPKR
jgi:8-oxo-dGTP pyrophosphatase MutT (NUDIX family)